MSSNHTQLPLNKRLREHRKAASLTQKELAERIPYSNSYISRFERGERHVPKEYLNEVVRVLHLTQREESELWQLFGATQQKKTKLVSEVAIDASEMPDLPLLHGRQNEFNTLSQWLITDRCQLIGILGLGGIGKTALACQLVESTKAEFDLIIWRPLRNGPRLWKVLQDCILICSQQQGLFQTETFDVLWETLFAYLCQKRILIVFDNAETIFEARQFGKYRPGYANYGQLFRQIIQNEHSSSLLLTSREKPPEMVKLAYENRSVQTLSLTGLSVEAGREVLTSKAVAGSPAVQQQLIEQYSGNPLALILVAERIRDIHAGQIDHFLREDGLFFGEIEDLLTVQFNRLESVEQDVLVWLAIARQMTTQNELDRLMLLTHKPKIGDALQSLQRRSLVEPSGTGFTLQNVIAEYLTDQLVTRSIDEIKSGQLDWLHRYALLLTQRPDEVRLSQTRLIIEPILHQLNILYTIEQLKQRLQKLIRQPTVTASYWGGNLLNLLLTCKTTLHRFDCRGLTIRQAYLAEGQLHQVNFQEAQFHQTVFRNTFGSIQALDISSNGRYAAIGLVDNSIHLWDSQMWQRQQLYIGHTCFVVAIAFSPDGRYLVSAADDQTIRLWQVETGHCLHIWQQPNEKYWALAFSPNGKVLVVGCHETIQVWFVDSPLEYEFGQHRQVLHGHTGRVKTIVFDPHGAWFASGGRDGKILLWSTENWELIGELEGHSEQVQDLDTNQDGRWLVSGSHDHTVKLWDVSTRQCVQTFIGHKGLVRAVAINSDGQAIVSGDTAGTLRVWQANTGRCNQVWLGHSDVVEVLAYNHLDQTFISGSFDKTFRQWQLDKATSVNTWRGHTNMVLRITVDRLGRYIASCSEDRLVRLWSYQGELLTIFHSPHHRDWAITFSPTEDLVAIGSEEGQIYLQQLPTGRLHLLLNQHSSNIWGLAFDLTGQYLASCSNDETVRLWRVADGACLHTMHGHTDEIFGLDFHPSGEFIATGGHDKIIHVWETATGICHQQLVTQSTIRALCFTPDGTRLVAGCDMFVQIWQLDTETYTTVPSEHTSIIYTINISADGQWLATGSYDMTIHLWEMDSLTCKHILKGHTNGVFDLVFSPDSSQIISGSGDGTIKIWDVVTGHCLHTLRPPQPYEGCDITGATGLSAHQRQALQSLGAIDNS